MSEDKRLIYFLISLIIFLAIVLLVKIKTTPKYNPEVYAKIYKEYEDIFGKEDSKLEFDENNVRNIEGNNIITDEHNSQTTGVGYIGTSNKEQGNVIGELSIPQINIKCPILKKTTQEYLEIAPTKYCGPEINEIRKSSYSWS